MRLHNVVKKLIHTCIYMFLMRVEKEERKKQAHVRVDPLNIVDKISILLNFDHSAAIECTLNSNSTEMHFLFR